MQTYRWIIFFLLPLLINITVTTEAIAYTTPKAFMDLYFNFTGSHESDFPKSKTTIAQYLYQSEKALKKDDPTAGPLILVLESSIYVYDKDRSLLFTKLLRTNRHSGFFELTSVSHIGPALSYLAKIKQNGSKSWRPAMTQLLKDIRQVQALNARQKNNWLDQANIQAWARHKKSIKQMVDYAMSMSGNYIVSILNGAPFTAQTLQSEFLDGNKDYPIAYNTVMVGTFMLTALESMVEIYQGIAPLKLDWPHTMVIIHNVAGANVTAGLTAGNNWMVPLFQALANGQLPADRLIIAPYAKVTANVGKNPLPKAEYDYYTARVWAAVYNRTHIANQVFSHLTSIYLPKRPAIPGDYGFSDASDIMDFMIRLKFSLANANQMLSNTVGFWMAGELQAKCWDLNKVDIPGLTDGFPKGITAYPSSNPAIPSYSSSHGL